MKSPSLSLRVIALWLCLCLFLQAVPPIEWKLVTVRENSGTWRQAIKARLIPGVLYSLQYTPNLSTGSWSTIATQYGMGQEWLCPVLPGQPPAADASPSPIPTAPPPEQASIRAANLVLGKNALGQPVVSWASLDDGAMKRKTLAGALDPAWENHNSFYLNPHGGHFLAIAPQLGAVDAGADSATFGPQDEAMLAVLQEDFPEITASVTTNLAAAPSWTPPVANPDAKGFYRLHANYGVDSNNDGVPDWLSFERGENPFAPVSPGTGGNDGSGGNGNGNGNGNGGHPPERAVPGNPDLTWARTPEGRFVWIPVDEPGRNYRAVDMSCAGHVLFRYRSDDPIDYLRDPAGMVWDPGQASGSRFRTLPFDPKGFALRMVEPPEEPSGEDAKPKPPKLVSQGVPLPMRNDETNNHKLSVSVHSIGADGSVMGNVIYDYKKDEGEHEESPTVRSSPDKGNYVFLWPCGQGGGYGKCELLGNNRGYRHYDVDDKKGEIFITWTTNSAVGFLDDWTGGEPSVKALVYDQDRGDVAATDLVVLAYPVANGMVKNASGVAGFPGHPTSPGAGGWLMSFISSRFLVPWKTSPHRIGAAYNGANGTVIVPEDIYADSITELPSGGWAIGTYDDDLNLPSGNGFKQTTGAFGVLRFDARGNGIGNGDGGRDIWRNGEWMTFTEATGLPAGTFTGIFPKKITKEGLIWASNAEGTRNGILAPIDITAVFGSQPTDAPASGETRDSEQILRDYLNAVKFLGEGNQWLIKGKDAQGKLRFYGVEIATSEGPLLAALQAYGSIVIFDGHSNFGIGPAYDEMQAITDISHFTNFGAGYTDVPLNFRSRGNLADPKNWGKHGASHLVIPDETLPANPLNYAPAPYPVERFPNDDNVGLGQPFTKQGTGYGTWHFKEKVSKQERLMIPAPNTDVPPLRYKTFFYNACSSGKDYIENFQHGEFVYTTKPVWISRATQLFIEGVIKGMSTGAIINHLHEMKSGSANGLKDYEFKNF